MKKALVLTIMILALSLQTLAQVDYGFGHVSRKRDFKHIPTVGVKGGYTFYDMKFSITDYNKLPGKMVMNPGFGAFIEYDVNLWKIQGITIGGELMAISRGYEKDFDYRGSIHEIDRMDAKYIDLRIPISYYLFSENAVTPYVFVAPDFAFCYGGTWSKTYPNKEVTNQSVDIAESNAVIAPFDLCLNMGAGCRFRIKHPVFSVIIKMDASYNLGLLNVKTSNDGHPVDVSTYTFEKEIRKNQGFEFMLSIGMPLKLNLKHDACWGM